MNISIIGPTGDRKSILTKKLQDKFNMTLIEPSEIFRQNISQKTPLGILSQEYFNNDELVPNNIVDAMVKSEIYHTSGENLLFDGFPKNIVQANFLEELLKEKNEKLDLVVLIHFSEKIILKRLKDEIVCSTCHSFTPISDNSSYECEICGNQLHEPKEEDFLHLKNRLRSFHRVSHSLIEYFLKKLIIIDCDDIYDDSVKISQRILDNVVSYEKNIRELSHPVEIKKIIKDKKQTLKDFDNQTNSIVLIGAPGSGKGTQATFLKDKFKLLHIATGDLFRYNLRNNTELGKAAKSFISEGNLVPDNITEAMLVEKLKKVDVKNGFILDGFPRNIQQTEALFEILNDIKRSISTVIYIKVPDKEIISRLSGRLICSKCQTPYHKKFNPPKKEGFCDECSGELYCRKDDNPETVKNRLLTFHSETEPILDRFKEENLLVEINGKDKPENVFKKILEKVESRS